MKKMLTILMAAIMTLSLAACGASMTKEEMLEQARPLNIGKLIKDYEDNAVKAKDTYLDQCFTVVGKVTEIDNDGVTIAPTNYEDPHSVHISSTAIGSTSMQCVAELPKEENVELSKGDVITVVGQLTDFGDQAPQMKISNAHFVDAFVPVHGKIKSIAAHVATDFFPGTDGAVLSIQVEERMSESKANFYYVCFPDAEDAFAESVEFDGETFVEGDVVTIIGKLNEFGVHANEFWMNPLESMRKD